MARLALRIRDSFGIEPPLAELFLRPTIEHIATLIDAAPAAAPGKAHAIALLDRSRYAARPDTSDPFIAAAAARVTRANT
jgi:hypothetical protein